MLDTAPMTGKVLARKISEQEESDGEGVQQ
jgi:hypothetical protein